MKKPFRLIAMVTLFALALQLNTVVAATPQVLEEVAKDTNYRIGKLDNGLTYYIRHSENPKGYADFYIAHHVGSLQEEDNQRGLAHFLEHMAFNGTKHFPDKALLEYFASIGVKFGHNINAFTSMDRTVYNISSVPVDLRSSIIDSTLLALHDWSHYISCEPEEIELERGVVREEWRRGDDSRTRMMKGINQLVQTGSRFAERDVIGLMEVIDNFSRETLIDYYHKWYRPDLQAIIVAGDVDVDDMERRIKERFSTIPKVENGAERVVYSIPNNTRPIVGFNTDPESRAVSVRLVVKIDNLTKEEKASIRGIEEEVLSTLFMDMIRERFNFATNNPNSGSRVLVPVWGESNYAATTFTVTALPRDNKNLLGAIEDVIIEVERLIQHGFEPEELATAKVLAKAKMRKDYNRNKDYRNRDFADLAMNHYTRGDALFDVKEAYKLSLQVLNRIEIEDINNSINRYLRRDNRVIAFAIPESLSPHLPSEDEVISMLEKTASNDLEPYAVPTDRELVIPQLAEARTLPKVTPYTEVEGAYQWTLPNGVRVIWKEDKGQDGLIKMKGFRKGGYSTDLSPEELKILSSSLLHFTVNGLNRNDMEQWSIKNGATVKPRLYATENELNGHFSEKSIDQFFSLLYHQFTDVKLGERDLIRMRERLLKDYSTEPGEMNKFRELVRETRFSKRPLAHNYTKEFIHNLNSHQIEQLYEQVFTNPDGYTFIFAGPLSKEEGVKYTTKYIGAVEKRQDKPSKFVRKDSERRKGIHATRYLAPNMLSTKASVSRYYHANVEYNAENSLVVKYLLYIMRERYLHSIREEKGGTYHVGVLGELVRHPEEILALQIEFDTDPQLVDELLEEVDKAIVDIMAKGPTAREMREVTLYLEKFYGDRAEEQILTTIYNRLTDYVDITRDEANYMGQIKASDVQKMARRLFDSGNKMTFVFEPVLD